MAYDIVINDPISAYFQLNFNDRFALSRSGVVAPFFTQFTAEGGKRVQIPYWTRDTTDSEADVGGTLTFVQAASKSELAYVQRRARPRKQTNAETQALGATGTPLNFFASETVDYWATQMEKTFWSGILKGLFGPNGLLLAAHSLNTAKTSGTPQPATRNDIARAKAVIGDNADQLKVMICHSSVATDLKMQAITSNIPYDPMNFQGMVVLEDDNVPTLSGSGDYYVYPTFMFAPGSLGLAIQANIENKVAWDPDINADKMVQSMAWAGHLFGASFTGTPASEEGGPTNAELATYTNWTLRTNVTTKDVKIACLLSNISKR